RPRTPRHWPTLKVVACERPEVKAVDLLWPREPSTTGVGPRAGRRPPGGPGAEPGRAGGGGGSDPYAAGSESPRKRSMTAAAEGSTAAKAVRPAMKVTR